MKGLKKGLAGVLSIVLAVSGMTFSAFSAKADESDFEYEVVDGGARITYYEEVDQDVVVPDQLGGYPVVSIGEGAFYACMDILSIQLPETVTEIGPHAFATCWCMTDITLPAGVRTIGEGAFMYCLDLVTLAIPSGVTEVPVRMFSMCDQLRNVTIPDTVTSIGEKAFFHCASLEHITIPNSVTQIGTDAFSDCNSLRSIEIPPSVTDIADYAMGFKSDPAGNHNALVLEIIGEAGSAAEAYANANGFIFTAKEYAAEPEIVEPVAVTGVQATYEDGQIKLTWDDCGAVQYKVSRSDGRSGYTNLTYRATADGWNDTKDLIPSQLYYYRIAGYFEDADGNLVQGPISEHVAAVATDHDPAKVTGVVATVSGKNVTLNWDAADAARYYKVSRAAGATGKYYTMKYNIDNTSYADTNLNAGLYRYKVVGYYKNVDGNWVYGDLCDTLYVTVK